MADNVHITECAGLALATIMARKGVDAAVIGERLGLAIPEGPRAVTKGALSVIGVGPGVWIAVSEDENSDLAGALAQSLAGVASVSDQSGGYIVLQMTGPGAADLLQGGAHIDLHPEVFGVGAAAVTVIAHIGVIVWKVDDGPTFNVAFFRSFAGSFHDWIAAHSVSAA